ncbi:hypothetical protein MJG53_013696 [Ovis ammon polii x Ovis aries]|uniref:Uncharacterized protein n=1 Tax=Ovis ammon polii x Ovis aries TaxID=2918886 RepID=A0ACB9UJL2_9CETA|nr:hypothetical protein MJG53_013696 [Ovis ammon polii x Ovis aries]
MLKPKASLEFLCAFLWSPRMLASRVCGDEESQDPDPTKGQYFTMEKSEQVLIGCPCEGAWSHFTQLLQASRGWCSQPVCVLFPHQTGSLYLERDSFEFLCGSRYAMDRKT